MDLFLFRYLAISMSTVKQSPASVKMNGEIAKMLPHFHSNYLKELPSLKRVHKTT